MDKMSSSERGKNSEIEILHVDCNSRKEEKENESEKKRVLESDSGKENYVASISHKLEGLRLEENFKSTIHMKLENKEKDNILDPISDKLKGLKLNDKFDLKTNSTSEEPESKSTSGSNESDEKDEQESVSEDGLIARGPCPTKFEKNRNNTHPYSRPSMSPYSDSSSTSSQESPPIWDEIPVVKFGSGMNKLLYDINFDEGYPVSPPNRHQYMHKNGGNMQIAKSQNTSTVILPCSPYLNIISSPSNSSNFSNSSISPSASPDVYSITSTLESDSLDSYPDFTCVQTRKEDDDDCEIPDDIIEFVDTYSNGNKLENPNLMHNAVDQILSNLRDNSTNGHTQPAIPITILEEEQKIKENQRHLLQNQIIQPKVFPSNTLQQQQQNQTNLNQNMIITNGVNPQYNSSPITIVLISDEEQTKSPHFRPIKPKIDIPPCNNSPSVRVRTTFNHCKEKRNEILSRYPEAVRRKLHCDITKCSDEKLSQIDEEGDTKLHIAIANNLEVPSLFLIDRFASSSVLDLDICNFSKETPLLCAVKQKMCDIVEYLLESGADPNKICSPDGETALHYAAQRGSLFLKVIEALGTSSHLVIDCFDNKGRIPLHLAILNNGREKCIIPNQHIIVDSLPTIRYLLRHGASILCQEKLCGKNAIHMALESRSLLILKLICEECDAKLVQKAVNMPNYSGFAPLHFVATMKECSENEQKDFVELLIKMGACIRLANREHKIPADLVDKDRKQIRNILLPGRPKNSQRIK